MSIEKSNLRRVELVLLVAGLVLTGVAAALYVGGRVYSRVAVARFQSASRSAPTGERPAVRRGTPVDYSLWSPKRVKQYEASLAEHFDAPLAVLKVGKIRLEVPIFEGTSELVLNRGVGRIEGTARIGESGNIGIAGHRDGFFRGLKDVSIGDTMELETARGTQTYMIDSIRLVERDDVSVLINEPNSEVTLVTCFPFYFVGSAPLRYIVHATLQDETRTMNESAKASSQATASRSKENTQ